MKSRVAGLVAMTAAVALTSIAAAGSSATKQRVQIDMKSKEFAGNTFVLAPFKAGAIKRDSGTQGCVYESHRDFVRDGQEGHTWECPDWTFVGKHGKLVLRTRFTWTDAGLYNIATGTWKVVSGTGQYARITGAGRSAHVGGGTWMRARYQGFLTSP
jgi:hypothetical protein